MKKTNHDQKKIIYQSDGIDIYLEQTSHRGQPNDQSQGLQPD